MFKKEDGFTLIEMLIVLTIISLLIILIIPNLGAKSKDVSEKGCEALEQVVQTQVDAYFLDKREYPSDLIELKKEKYITAEQMSCKNNNQFMINDEGKVYIPGKS